MINPRRTYDKQEATDWPLPNYWDLIALVLVVAVIVLFGWAAKTMVGHYQLGQMLPIDLNMRSLPYYALRSVTRMFIALGFSVIFTFVFGAWAAKSKTAEKIIISLVDILQSVPVLAFLSITVVGFVSLFQGSLLGPEAAAIFAVFVAQLWNMLLSFYQSLKTLPKELHEVASLFQLSAWQKFWKIEVPFAMPSLLWNAMMSMSGSWVFLMASEVLSVGDQLITLPGLGSFIYLASQKANVAAIVSVIVTMFLVITIYDQLFFRPLIVWAEKFRTGSLSEDQEPQSWVWSLFQRSQLFAHATRLAAWFCDIWINNRFFRYVPTRRFFQPSVSMQKIIRWVGCVVLSILVFIASIWLLYYIRANFTLNEVLHVFVLGLITGLRVMLLIVLCSLIWVPVGVWVGQRPRLIAIVQPIAQILAAFPVNLLFPLVAYLVVTRHLNVEIWTAPLMVLGTQWYILFNVIAGTAALPKDLTNAVEVLQVRGWLKWRRYILPGIFPYFLTGVITAAGGAWNVSIVAEIIDWGQYHLRATGIGAYIALAYASGHFPNLVLGVVIMIFLVLVINRVLWRPLYRMAEERYQMRIN